MVGKEERKFKLKSELVLFKALQKYGRMASRKLSAKIGFSANTIQNVIGRIDGRDFYYNGMMPKLEKFSEIPMAFLTFSDIHPERLRKLEKISSRNERVRGLVYGEKDVLLILMDEDKGALANLIFEIMELVQARPVTHLITPTIAKIDLTIPGKVLDKVYSGLPDKRRK